MSHQQIAAFIVSPVTGNILEVPGVTEESRQILQKIGVVSSYQLFGMYLSAQGDGADKTEITKAFHARLNEIRYPFDLITTCVQAVGEKLNISFPGVYDSALYCMEDEVEEEVLSIKPPSFKPVEERLSVLEYTTHTLCNEVEGVISRHGGFMDLVDTNEKLDRHIKKMESMINLLLGRVALLENESRQQKEKIALLRERVASTNLEISTNQEYAHADSLDLNERITAVCEEVSKIKYTLSKR